VIAMPGVAAQPLPIEHLTAQAFAPFGDVIEAASARESYPINDGTAQRHHDITRVDCSAGDGHALVSIVTAQPRELPFDIVMLERHPLGSQAFMPLSPALYLVVVAQSPGAMPHAFLASQGQGINYHRGTWHHPLIALDDTADFLVVDRGGDGNNCDVADLPTVYRLAREALPAAMGATTRQP